MSIWNRGPITVNPYLRTAFRVTRVPREVVRHRTIAQLVSQTRQVVAADPRAHAIKGQPVAMTEINAAEEVLSDPGQRILEELLHHSEERLPVARMRKLLREVTREMTPQPESELPISNLSGLRPWARKLLCDFLSQAPGPDPSFGALETDLVPPFGRPGDE